MLGMPILDVALGMIFLYLLLSLVCTSVVEFVAGITKKRAGFLTEAIIELLDDPGIAKAAEAAGARAAQSLPTAEAFYDHPLIRSLYRTAGDSGSVALDDKRSKPSYIPARTFALTLLDMVARSQPQAGAAATGGQAGAASEAGQPAAGAKDGQTGADAGSGHAPAGLGTTVVSAAQTGSQQVQQLVDAVNRLPDDSYIKKTLQVLIADARGDIDRVQANVEIWYNHAMDRVSGWYKRWSNVIIFVLSLAISVGANADSVSIAMQLSSNSALRQAVAAQAEAYAKKPDAGKTAQDSSLSAIRASVAELNGLGISLGWTPNDWANRTAGQRALKVLGLLLTAFAVSLGAPFWFDMLNKVITIRTAGKSPEDKPKSPEGGPKRKEEAAPE